MAIRIAFYSAFALLLAAYLGFEVYVIGLERAHFSMHPLETRDFANYWMAARLAADGHPQILFDPVAYLAALREQFGADYPWHNWSYPPHFLFFCLPLAYLPYHAAWALFLGSTLVFFYAAARAYVRNVIPGPEGRAIWTDPLFCLLPLAFVVANINFAQNGFLTGGLMLFAFAFWRSRSAIAGVFLALLTVKPQLGLLLPLLLLLDRNWTAILSAVATTLALGAASAIAFGGDAWVSYVTVSMPYQTRVLTEFGDGDRYLAMMLSAYTAMRNLGYSGAAPWLAQGVFAIAGLALLATVLTRAGDDATRFASLLLATFLVVPYTFNYDAGALVVACAALAVCAGRQWRRCAQAGLSTGVTEAKFRALSLVAATPILANLMAIFVAPLGPAILLGALAAVALAAVTPLPAARPASLAAASG